MSIREITDLDQARRFCLEGLWLQRLVAPAAATVRPVLEWALAAASAGQPLPPLGFLADLGHAAFGLDRNSPAGFPRPGLPAGLERSYEDHVLGKLYADRNFERASDALRHFPDKDRPKGLAFVLGQVLERTGCPGVFLSPAVIKGLLERPAEELLSQGWDMQAPLLPLLPEMYEELVASCRRTGELVGPEDVFELEHGTALANLGQRVALRQLLQATHRLESTLPLHRPRPLPRPQQVPTRVLDEDIYPVGGYASISSRGSIESMLQSQLALMDGPRPDLFDIKYLRDELLYYSRDENQFLRRRRSFVIALFPDLPATRFKDVELPWQRCILWLGLLLAAVRRLGDWLSTDALLFEFLFLDEGKPSLLAAEEELLRMVLREALANGTARLNRLPHAGLMIDHCRRLSRNSLCHCLAVAAADPGPQWIEHTVVSRLVVHGPCPALSLASEQPVAPEADTPLDVWSAALLSVLRWWV